MEYNELSSVPNKVSINTAKITAFSNNRLVVENYKGIVLYSNTNIEINTDKYLLRITGENLLIKYMTKEELQIDGEILNIEFDK